MARKPTVLFVDDDPTTRRIYEYKLTLSGVPHHVVDSAEAAIRVLEEHEIDVVVTDLIMPRYEGTDLIEGLRECVATKHIPVILFTTGGNEEKVMAAVRAGATEVLPKHSTPPDKLIERLHALTRDRLSTPAPQNV